MALEVVTDDNLGMSKLKRMTRKMYTTREHGTGHVFWFVCRLFFFFFFLLIDNINLCVISCAVM